jgi:protein-S-isoprenylcysteine O-methyltransferase Ste14
MVLWLKNIAFTLLVPGVVGVLVPWWLGRRTLAGSLWPWDWNQWVALPLLLTGVLVYGWCLWDFIHVGQGTPAPWDAPRRLVARGLYQFVRNPMYYGVLNVIAGWVVFFASLDVAVYALLVGVGFHLFVRFVEEPALAQRFGVEYAFYCRAVNRWLPGKPRLEASEKAPPTGA